MKLPTPKNQRERNTQAVFASCDWSRLPHSFSISQSELKKNLDSKVYTKWVKDAGGEEAMLYGLNSLVRKLIKGHSKQELEFVKIAYLKYKAELEAAE